MPQWKKLPNGEWGFVPDPDPYTAHLRPQVRTQKPSGNIFGSALEAIKSIPSGFIDVPASMLEAGIGVVTPGIDLPLEKRLRQFADKRQQEGLLFKRDPTYREALLPKVGMGLGQIGALSGLARLGGPYGFALSALAGIGLGISEQTRRIAEREQRTSTDIPWYKESAAHLLGGTIGLSEVLPVARMLRVFPQATANPLMKRMLADKVVPKTTGAQVRSALEGTVFEGLQEGMAQGLQSTVARGLYDPDALDNLVASMVEEAKVGGIVGGIADFMATSMARHNKYGRGGRTADGTESEIEARRADNAWSKSTDGKAYLDLMDRGLIQKELGGVYTEYQVPDELAQDLNSIFNGESAILPDPMLAVMQDGGIDLDIMEDLRDEFQARGQHAVDELNNLAANQPDGSTKGFQFRNAARAASDILTSRVQRMNEVLESAGHGFGKMGGLTESEQYQAAKRAESLDPTFETATQIAKKRKDGTTTEGYKNIIEDFMGGSYGRRGLFRIAEVLGVHGGPGSLEVQDIVESDGTLPDPTKSSSDRANFSLQDVGKVLFGETGRSANVAGMPFADADDSAALGEIDKEIAFLEKQEQELFDQYPGIRAAAEAKGQTYDSVESWEKDRDANNRQVLLKRGQIHSLIAEQKNKRNEIYATMVYNRLAHVKDQLITSPAATTEENLKLKERAVKALQLTDSKDPNEQNKAFDSWLLNTVDAAKRTLDRGLANQVARQQQAQKIERQIKAFQNDPDADPNKVIKLESKLRNELHAFNPFPKDVSAGQLERLTRLFNTDIRDAQESFDQRLELRAGFDIAKWQTDNSRTLLAGGLPNIDPSLSVVKKFVEEVLPQRQKIKEKIDKELEKRARTGKGLLPSQIANKIFKKGTQAQRIKDFDNANRLVAEEDIHELLESKNIFLRGMVPPKQKDKAVKGNIGKALEEKLGTGVRSRPFERLLENLTGAKSWKNATSGQRMLMYSRLLQLPPHRIHPSLDPDTAQPGQDVEFEPMFLPNLEQNKLADRHIDAIVDDIVGPTPAPKEETIIAEMRKRVKDDLGEDFDGIEFNEALASLIESGFMVHGGQSDIQLMNDKVKKPEKGDVAATVDGEIKTPSNPATVETPDYGDVLDVRAEGEIASEVLVDATTEMMPDFKYQAHPLELIASGQKIILTIDPIYSKRLNFNDVVILSDRSTKSERPLDDLAQDILANPDKYTPELIAQKLREVGNPAKVRILSNGVDLKWEFNEQQLTEIIVKQGTYNDEIKKYRSQKKKNTAGMKIVSRAVVRVIEDAAPTKRKSQDMEKAALSTKFIGSSTESKGLANIYAELMPNVGTYLTNNQDALSYRPEDIVWVQTDPGKKNNSKPVIDGVLQGDYRAIDLAIAAKSSIIMDRASKVAATDVGQKQIIEYLKNKGYIRLDRNALTAQNPGAGPYIPNLNSDNGVWVHNSSVEWAQENGSSAVSFVDLVNTGHQSVAIELARDDRLIQEWTERAQEIEDARNEYLRTGVLPSLGIHDAVEGQYAGLLADLFAYDPRILSPVGASKTAKQGLLAGSDDGVSQIGRILRENLGGRDADNQVAEGERFTALERVIPLLRYITRETGEVGPTIEEWNEILDSIGLKHVPYDQFIPDISIEDITDSMFEEYVEYAEDALGTQLPGTVFTKEDVLYYEKYKKLHRLILPTVKTNLVVGHQTARNVLGYSANNGRDPVSPQASDQITFIDRPVLQEYWQQKGKKALSKDTMVRDDADPSIYRIVRRMVPLAAPGLTPRDGFAREIDALVQLIGHEKGHTMLPLMMAGTGYTAEYAQGAVGRSIVEDLVNNIGLNEMARIAWIAVRDRVAAKEIAERRAAPKEFEVDKVRVEQDRHDPVGEGIEQLRDQLISKEDMFTKRQESAGPGDHRTREIDRKIFEYEVKPKRVKEILKDDNLKEPIEAARRRWNENNPDEKLTTKEYVERFASYITSELGLQELEDAGVLESIGGNLKRAEQAPVEDTFLQINTTEGSKILNAVIASGAVPSSMKRRTSAVRRTYLEQVKKRMEIFKVQVDKTLTKMRIPDNIKVQFVDNADSLFQGLSEVAIRGEMLPETQAAVYDSASNRIIINLAAIDPDNMLDAVDVIQQATFHEGIHALIMRDHLYESELQVLGNFVRNNVVSEEVDPKAHEMNVTWFEKAVYDLKDSNLSEGDIEHEAVVSLMEALAQDKVPEARKGNLRKTKGRVTAMIESVMGAAQDSEILGVMQILGQIESGRIGERGSGYLGDTEFDSEKDEVRSLRLTRYADPQELDELTKAVALRNAAPSGSMREAEQAKIDKITSAMVNRRARIQESAQPVDDLTGIDNEKMAVQEVRDTNSYAIPLLNGSMWTSPDNMEARKVALDEYLKIRRDETGYTMPRDWMDMFDKQTKNTTFADELLQSAVTDGLVAKTRKGGSFRKSLEDGALGPDQVSGENPKETLENMEKQVGDDKTAGEQFRYNFLDRRQWLVKQTDKMLQLQNRAQLDAETSALVAMRNADNAVNYLPAIMKRGPLSYLGLGTGRGEFDVAPAFDDQLQEKYGGDGRVLGLLDVFAFITNPKDEALANLYGIAKRIRWTKQRRDEVRRRLYPDAEAVNLLPEFQPPELLAELNMFDRAYEQINPKDKDGIRSWSGSRITDIITEVESNNPHIIEFWDHYQAFNRKMIETSFRTGLISRSQRDEWMSMPYTPFYRETSTISQSTVGSSGEMAKRGRVMVEKALTGSLEPIKGDLMDNIMVNTQALVRDVMMNVASARTARDAVALGDAREVSLSSMAANADNRVIRVMENGEAKYYELDDPQLAMSTMMLGFNPKKQLSDLFGGGKPGKALSSLLTGSSQFLRESVTRTPAFQFKNIFRDAWNASTLVGGGPGLLLDAMKNAIDPDVLRRAEEAGLSIGIDFIAEPGKYGDKMKKQLRDANPDWKNPLTPVSVAWTFLGRIAKQSEVATRVAVHDRVLALTGDRALAQYMAVEIMNYGRRGANPGLSTFLSTVPFMNGRLQGLDVLYRGIRDKKGSSDIPGIYGYGLSRDEYQDLPLWRKNRQQLVGRGMMLTAASMLYYLMMHDDEEYQSQRDEVKADNWLIPLSEHAWLKVPIPFEVGVLFKVIPEQLMMALLEADHDMGDVGEETFRQLRTSLSLGAPQAIAPLFNAARNYDTFRKDAIVDQYTALREPNQQREIYTSNVARSIADTFNMIPVINKMDFLTSPMKVEYMLRQYLGTMGGYAISAADRVARLGVFPSVPFDPLMNWSEAENIVGTNVDYDWESMIGGPGVANVPILGDLLMDPRGGAGRQQDFYEILNELDEVTATLNNINETDRRRGYSYKEKNRDLLYQKNRLNHVRRRMQDWRNDRERLQRIPRSRMSDEEKRRKYAILLDIRAGILHDIEDIMARTRGVRP